MLIPSPARDLPYSYMTVLTMSRGTSGDMIPDSRTKPPSRHSLRTFRVSVLSPTGTLARRPYTPCVKLRSPTASERSCSVIHGLRVMQRASPANTTASVAVMRPQLRLSHSLNTEYCGTIKLRSGYYFCLRSVVVAVQVVVVVTMEKVLWWRSMVV